MKIWKDNITIKNILGGFFALFKYCLFCVCKMCNLFTKQGQS